jgi:Flp pilus assembly protein TadD
MTQPETVNTPLVTAIVVTRNEESHIRECLRGLMEQSVAGRMEVIVVDQGSEQTETAIVADLQRSYANVISLRTSAAAHKSAVSRAIKMATGKYLTILDAADRLRDNAYEIMATALDGAPEAMIVYGDTCWTAVPHETFARHTSLGKMTWPDYTLAQIAQLPQIAPHPMWRRELHDRIGAFPEGDDAVRELFVRTMEGFRVLHLQEFTGLKLMAAEGMQCRAAAPAYVEQQTVLHREAAVSASFEEPAYQPKPLSGEAYAATEPMAPAGEAYATITVKAAAGETGAAIQPEPSADEAYAAIKPLLAGDERQAVQAIEKHLEKYPNHPTAHNDLGALWYRLGDSERAVAHYRKAAELSPEEATYQKNLADVLYVEMGEVDQAIAIYLQLHKNNPRDVETLLNLGIICQGVGQPTEAETFMMRALELEPWNQAVRERLTALRDSQAEAEEEEDDETAEDHYGKAQALVKEGDMAGAERELERTLVSYPDFAPAHNDLGVIQYQKGEMDQAQAHYEKAAALVPANATFQKNLADFYFVEGRNVDGAIAIYLDQLRREPGNVETLMSLGRICAMLDRPQEAESFFGKVTELEPWNQGARECLTNLRHCANG